ncbi:MAG: metallophosphoesterase [Ruminococcaceae bacterium]|nr:metallophosphoesterase [Oscillospiraceae bacterium]
MKKFISILLAVTILVSVFVVAVNADDDKVTFAVASDLHYNVPEEELTATNDHPIFWYANRRAAMDNESGFIIDEFLKQAEEAEYDFILIPGDMADDGRIEKEEHEAVSAKFKAFEEKTGIPIYVVPGNHDYGRGENDNKIEDMFAYYGDFGYNEAFEKRENDFSYVTDLPGDYRLIACDSNDPSKSTEDGMTSDKVNWVVKQAEKAVEDGKYPILMMHHNLLDHLPMQRILSRNFIIRNHTAVANKFANAGIKLVFTGHEHCSDVAVHTSPKGNKIYDFANTALSMYPLAYRSFTMTEEEIIYESKTIDEIDTATLRSQVNGYTDEMIAEMDKGLNDFAKGYLKAGVQYRLARSLTMEQMGIAEDSIFYNLVNTAVTGLTDLLEMPLYGENSVQELAKQYNVVIPDSEYENGWDLATDLVSYHYAGGEDFSIYSTEVTILLRMVNLILLDDLSTVNDEVFFGALNEVLGDDSALFKNFTKGIANALGPVTPGQYLLIAIASPIVYEFVYDSDGVDDNNGTLEGYGVEQNLHENRTDNFADFLETIAIYLENFFTIFAKIFGIGR